ncbi:MAG: DNA repair protein RadC [Bacteroidaceae bacterium]|nr:DNA repair protein RadC [Bacteroidaceae bacterium]
MLRITDWAEEDRPREKLMAQGASALSTAELMAILIGSGGPGTSAVDLMRQVLSDYDDSLRMLGRATVRELIKYRGMGEAKAVTVLAACQLAQRRLDEEARARRIIRSSRDIYDFFLPAMQDLPVEECRLLLMKQNCSVVGSVVLSRGGLTETAVDIRLLVKHALLADATVVALCHNHPSGSLSPSRQDDELTRRTAKACSMMNLHLLDHIILTDGAYYSYADEGRLGQI